MIDNIETVTIVAGVRIASTENDALDAQSAVVQRSVHMVSKSTRVSHVVVLDGVPTEL